MYKVVKASEAYHLTSWNKANPIMDVAKFADVSNPVYHRQHVLLALSQMKTRGGYMGQILYDLATFEGIELHIVCWPGVPGEFICDAEISDCKVPTIMWDPFACFRYYTRVGGNKNALQVKPALMPAWVVLAHELGHYRHAYLFSKWFKEEIAQGVDTIEARNLEDHESLILEDAKLPVRYNYQDFEAGAVRREIDTKKITVIGDWPDISTLRNDERLGMSDTLVDSVSQLKLDLGAAQKELDKKKVNADNELRTIQYVCEHCNKSFSGAVRLRMHINKEHP